MWDYTEKHASQRPHKEASYDVKEKRGKTVKFNRNTKNMNNMDAYTSPNKRGKKR